MFKVNRRSFLMNTELTKLRRRSTRYQKQFFLDTVVFGRIYYQPYAPKQLERIKELCRKEMRTIWGEEMVYVTDLHVK